MPTPPAVKAAVSKNPVLAFKVKKVIKKIRIAGIKPIIKLKR